MAMLDTTNALMARPPEESRPEGGQGATRKTSIRCSSDGHAASQHCAPACALSMQAACSLGSPPRRRPRSPRGCRALQQQPEQEQRRRTTCRSARPPPRCSCRRSSPPTARTARPPPTTAARRLCRCRPRPPSCRTTCRLSSPTSRPPQRPPNLTPRRPSLSAFSICSTRSSRWTMAALPSTTPTCPKAWSLTPTTLPLRTSPLAALWPPSCPNNRAPCSSPSPTSRRSRPRPRRRPPAAGAPPRRWRWRPP